MPGEASEIAGPNARDPATTATRIEDGWYSYAIVRIVPRVDRGESLNAGIILFARTLGFLEARLALDEARLRALAPGLDIEQVKAHLESFRLIAAGDLAGGPIASMSASERFHWLTSPRSTIIQTSPIHIGRCDDPETTIEELMGRLVR